MKTVLIALMTLAPFCGKAQWLFDRSAIPDTAARKPCSHPVRNGIWFLPTNVHQINGMAIGIWPMHIFNEDVTVRGVNVDLLPLSILLAPGAIVGTPFELFKRPDSAGLADTVLAADGNYYGDFYTAVQGIDIRIVGGMPVDKVSGISVNGFVNNCGVQQGVAISGLRNGAEDLHGVQLAFLGNVAKRGRGVQIALFNRATACNCIQIGLLNRNGRSLQPLVNWPHKQRNAVHKKTPAEPAGV